MKSNKRKSNRGLIVLNRGERIAMIHLLSLIVILLGICIFRPHLCSCKKERKAFHNLDSIIAANEQAKPEFETHHEELRQSPGKDGNSPNEETATPSKTGPVSNKSGTTSPKPVASPPKSASTPHKNGSTPSKTIPILDINTADSLVLVDLPQIGEVMASRIHRYRNRLGGFVSLEQLFEVKGMDTARFETIKPYIRLEDKEITRINVNRDEFKTLLRHPYLEYEQVKAIVNHRERKGLIKDWEELQGIVGTVNPLLEDYVNF